MPWQNRFAFQNRPSDVSQTIARIHQRVYRISLSRPDNGMLRGRYANSAGKIGWRGETLRKERTWEISENISTTDCYKTRASWCDNIYFSLFSQSQLFSAQSNINGKTRWISESLKNSFRFCIIKNIWKSFWHLLCFVSFYILLPIHGQ